MWASPAHLEKSYMEKEALRRFREHFPKVMQHPPWMWHHSVNRAWRKVISGAKEIWTTLALCAGHMNLAQSRRLSLDHGAWVFQNNGLLNKSE